MSIKNNNKYINLIYSRVEDCAIIQQFNNESKLGVRITVHILAISDEICDSIKYVLANIKNIDTAVLSFEKCKIDTVYCYDDIIKICNVFSGVNNFYLNVVNPFVYYHSLSAIIVFLQNVNTRRLIMHRRFVIFNDLVEIINNNENIICITLTVKSHKLDFPDTPVPKIDKVKINDDHKSITQTHLTKLFVLAPNMKSLYFNGNRYWKKSTPFICQNALENITEFLLNIQHFDELRFHNCGLTCDDTEFLCDNLVNCNVNSVILRGISSGRHPNMNCIVDLINKNKFMKQVEISTINSCTDLLTVVESLTKSNIDHFVSVLRLKAEDSISTMQEKVIDLLSDNYSLKFFSVKLEGYDAECFDTEQIIIRNCELENKKRFINTKCITSTD